MKNKILAKYPKSQLDTFKSNTLYIADFTKRTNNIRGVEISVAQPTDPNDPSKQMHYLVVENPNCISIDCNIFDDNQFVDPKSKVNRKHGECCFFPTINDGRSWFSIVEIKDCESKNIKYYYKEIKEKIDCMFDIFRNEIGIPNQIYFIISFPKGKIFDDSIFTNYIELKQMRRLRPLITNRFVVTDNHNIDIKQTLK